MFHERLQQAMSLKGLTPLLVAAEMTAKGCPMTAGSVDRWVSGDTTPRGVSAWVALRAVLSVSLDWLIAGVEVEEVVPV